MEGDPGGGHDETGGTEKDEHDAPAGAQHDPGEDGRRDGEADGLRGAHDGGGAAACGGAEPLARGADAGWVERGLADAEEDAEEKEGWERAHEAGEHLRGGPEGESGAEDEARADAVEKTDERELREAVGEGEGGEQPSHLRGVEVHLGADGGVGDGERGAIEKVDDAGEEEQRQRDCLVTAQAAGSGSVDHEPLLDFGRRSILCSTDRGCISERHRQSGLERAATRFPNATASVPSESATSLRTESAPT